ncbi:unnamed protein product, partial [Anisakis simplex]|uniref:Secreted protein n=1 Tax=Anisakis simplex TaxID=6269 RepID=A0A0M3KFF0_ANISI
MLLTHAGKPSQGNYPSVGCLGRSRVWCLFGVAPVLMMVLKCVSFQLCSMYVYIPPLRSSMFMIIDLSCHFYWSSGHSTQFDTNRYTLPDSSTSEESLHSVSSACCSSTVAAAGGGTGGISSRHIVVNRAEGGGYLSEGDSMLMSAGGAHNSSATSATANANDISVPGSLW